MRSAEEPRAPGARTCRIGPGRLGLIALALVFCWSSPVGAAPGAEGTPPPTKLWSALVIATNQRNPPPPPAALAPYVPVLARTFGYNRFDLIGERLAIPGPNDDRWLVPSTELFLQLQPRPGGDEKRSFYLVRLFQRDRPLFASEVGLADGSPLFIRGPLWGQGQLLLILERRP
jgi:hypothetical protein